MGDGGERDGEVTRQETGKATALRSGLCHSIFESGSRYLPITRVELLYVESETTVITSPTA